jgi:sec-independent protein translocase protein TatA
MIGTQELIVIFLIVLLLFGGKKIPEIARGLGKGLREFRRARDEIQEAIETEAAKAEHADPDEQAPAPPQENDADRTTETKA